jgi:hypothetical protein
VDIPNIVDFPINEDRRRFTSSRDEATIPEIQLLAAFLVLVIGKEAPLIPRPTESNSEFLASRVAAFSEYLSWLVVCCKGSRTVARRATSTSHGKIGAIGERV